MCENVVTGDDMCENVVVYAVLAARETAAAMQTAKARARGAHAGLSGVARSGAAGAGAPQGGVSAQ